MERKDDRSKACGKSLVSLKSKQHKLKQHNYRKATRNNNNVPGHTSSSSAREQTVRGVIDVADSSDEHFTSNRGWMHSKDGVQLTQQPQQSSLEDTLNDLDKLDNEQLHAPDFDQMAQMPTSIGGHFIFSSEKNWELPEDEQLLDKTEAAEYFTLNLKLLNVGLQTIPFYKRLDYPASLFSAAQLTAMEKAAEASEARYQEVLKEHIKDPRNRGNSASKRTTSAKSHVTTKTLIEENKVVEDVTAQVGKVTLDVNPAKENTDAAAAQDIQQWLDNVLDE